MEESSLGQIQSCTIDFEDPIAKQALENYQKFHERQADIEEVKFSRAGLKGWANPNLIRRELF